MNFENRKQPVETKLEKELCAIEQLPDVVRSEIILVIEGVKPAVSFGLYFQKGVPSYNQEHFQRDKKLLCELFDSVGLEYDYRFSSENFFESIVFVCAKQPEIIVSLKDAENAAVYGTLLGYPETAVLAYINGQCIDGLELKRIKELYPYARFLSFRMSQDHWQDELEHAHKAAEVLKNKAPVLYNKILSK